MEQVAPLPSAGGSVASTGGHVTDHHPFDPNAPPDSPPMNLEAEQALLGILMYENDAFVSVDEMLAADDFYEPFHGMLFGAIARDIRAGRRADPALLQTYFRIQPSFHEFGGLAYLMDLVDKAPPASTVAEYARGVRSMSLRRKVIKIAADMVAKAKEDPDVDGLDLMADLESQMLAARSGKDDVGFQSWAEVSRAVIYGMDSPEDRRLLNLGLPKLDNVIGGAERGDMIVLGGRPGMGKSALASCIALNVAQAGFGVAEVNGEMTTAQMGRRHLTDLAFAQYGRDAPQYRDLRRGTLTENQKRMVAGLHAQFEGLPLYLVKRTGLTLGRLRAMLAKRKMLFRSMGIDMALVVIDHVGLIRPDRESGSRQTDQSEVSGALKIMAEDLDVVIIALAQLNRNVEQREDKRPQLADLRDSGSWEQDADVVIGAYRDAYYARREKEPKRELEKAEHFMRASSPTVEAIMLKVREGDVGTANLWASIGHNAIRNDPPEDALLLV